MMNFDRRHFTSKSAGMGPVVGLEVLEIPVMDAHFSAAFLSCLSNLEYYKSVITEEDADRVWSCVQNAVQVMMEENT
jgi:hypothetical protein